MAAVLLSNMVSWSFIMGLLKGWTFLVLAFVAMSTFVAVKV